MSLVAYLEITDEELQPDAPILSSIGIRFRDNPIAIATRDSNAPWLNGVGASQLLTGSGNWTVPAEVFSVRAWLFGAGGGGGGAAEPNLSAQNGSSGGQTTFGGSSASGGAGGRGSVGTVGGTPESRDGANGTARGAGAAGGQGAQYATPDWSSSGGNGNPGQLTMTAIAVTPGQVISYSCGGGGSGGSTSGAIEGATGGNGANGFIYLEW